MFKQEIKITFKEKQIFENGRVASNVIERMKGLMFEKDMQNFDALLIVSCNAIHTCFMNFNIDVVFLNKSNEVVQIIRNLKPWRFTKIYFKADKVLEMVAGRLPDYIKPGDRLEVICLN